MNSKLKSSIRNAGYHTEPNINDKRTMIIEVPIDYGEGIRTLNSVSLWEREKKLKTKNGFKYLEIM